MWRRLPWWIVNLFYTPGKETKRFSAFQDTFRRTAGDLLKKVKEGNDDLDPDSGDSKDIMSILGMRSLSVLCTWHSNRTVRANAEDDEKRKLSDYEVLCQLM